MKMLNQNKFGSLFFTLIILLCITIPLSAQEMVPRQKSISLKSKDSINAIFDSIGMNTLKHIPSVDSWKNKHPFPESYYKHNHNKKPAADTSRKAIFSKNKVLPSSFGIGIFAGTTYQVYDGDMMRYFKHVSTFSMDFDLMYNEFMLTGKASWGGGKIYDTLSYNYWEWQPLTRISTTNYGLFMGYAIKENKLLKITPFAGLQSMKIKFKPRYYAIPVGIDNVMQATDVYSFGVHVELKGHFYNDNQKLFMGAGTRISYSYSFVTFPKLSGYMHQLSFNLGLSFRGTKIVEMNYD